MLSPSAHGRVEVDRRVHISRAPSSAFIPLHPEHLAAKELLARHVRPTSPEVILTGVAVVQDDVRLKPYAEYFLKRLALFSAVKARLAKSHGSLIRFAHGYNVFGFNRAVTAKGHHGWLYREWLPAATEVCLMGDFNEWNRESHPLTRYITSDAFINSVRTTTDQHNNNTPITFEKSLFDDQQLECSGIWYLFIQDKTDGTSALQHKCKIRICVRGESGEWVDRVPAWSRLAWQNSDTLMFDGVLWNPPEPYRFKYPAPTSVHAGLKIYECHIGISQEEEKVGTFVEFQANVLPRVQKLGYTAILIVGLLEHPFYGSFGGHVSSYFAPSSRYGTPDEFKALVDAAHGMGIAVTISLVHSHASTNALDGLNQIDGSEGAYFVEGEGGCHHAWSGRIFDMQKTEVLRYLLSTIAWFMEEYRLDGFRFEGVTSLIYSHHGIGTKFGDEDEMSAYFENVDLIDDFNCLYLMLANDVIHSMTGGNTNTVGARLSIAAEWTGMPTLGRAIEDGGMGFDFVYCNKVPQMWSQLLSGHDEGWSLGTVVWPLADRKFKQKSIVAAEDADNSLIARRPLRVAMFSWESLHTHAVGGVAPHVTELAAGLCRLGHEVHVFVRSTGTDQAENSHYGVIYHECCFDLSSDFVREMENMCNAFVWAMRDVESRYDWSFDICHSHDWLAARAVAQCKRMGRRCLLTMHSTEFGRCGNNAYGGTSKLIRDVEGEGCHMVDGVICVSGVLAHEVKSQYNIHEDKIRVVYNGIHCGHFDGFEDSGAIKANYGVGVMDPMFLFVGRLVEQKGPDLLIEAVPHVLKHRDDVKFIIVGDGHMRSTLESRANQLGVGHAVRFVGKKVGGDLKSLFKACDAVVVPSRNEPFGIVVLEGWSAYKPVVATTCGGPRDFVTHDVDGFLVDPNAGSIAWGCCEIVNNFAHSQWMGSRGRVKAAFNFNWDSIATNTLDFYYQLIGRQDAPIGVQRVGGQSMAFRLMGPAMYEHMSVFDNNDDRVSRGLAVHKMARLLTCGLGGDGYMNFMGNEFAHPEWIDMPRGSNSFSHYHARRRWDLADNTELLFKHFQLFDACMIHWEKLVGWLASNHQYVSLCQDDDKVLVFERGDALFIFNFHPSMDYSGYKLGCHIAERLKVFLDTDESRFGGQDRLADGHWTGVEVSQESHNNRPYSLCIDTLPARTALVLIGEARMKAITAQQLPDVISMGPDDFAVYMSSSCSAA
eukprot:GHVS01064420.1.p1 GENE.GHVS01064420.1~~GHVS01064420.1.p1  ORF type:complete len:1234 (-),score=144.64 GHVS01064420.1:207-3854(-)